MTTLKLLKWLAIIIITPWLLFMLIAVFSGGEPFTKMGESLVSYMQDMTVKLSKKADAIKIEADELREKVTGKKPEGKEVAEPAPKVVPKEKKTKKKKSAPKRAPADTDESQ